MNFGIITESRSERGILQNFMDVCVGHEYRLWGGNGVNYADLDWADWIISFGDRPEQLWQVMEAAKRNRPIAHIHGGDRTDSGYIDEAVRHSITRFAHLHFAACADSAKRLKRFGEQEHRIHNVGSLAIDGCIGIKPKGLKEPTALILYNPMTGENTSQMMTDIIHMAQSTCKEFVVVRPNGDSGSDRINEIIDMLSEYPDTEVSDTMPREEFLSYLADPLVTMYGNSSSMFIEASYFKTPYRHFGIRNLNRHYGGYGEGGTAVKILDILEKTVLTPEFMCKKVTY